MIAQLGVVLLSLTITVPRVGAQDSFSSQLKPDITVPPEPRAHTTQGQVMELDPRAQKTADTLLSNELNDYLHHHRLPYAEASVIRNGPDSSLSVTLTGQVRTQFGRQDAESKVSRFLNTEVSFNNQLTVNPGLSVDMVKQQQSDSLIELPKAFLDCWQGTASSGHYGKLEPGFHYLGGCPRASEVPSVEELCIGKTENGEYKNRIAIGIGSST